LAGDAERFLERTAKVQWALMVCVYFVSHVPALLMLKIPGYEGKDDDPENVESMIDSGNCPADRKNESSTQVKNIYECFSRDHDGSVRASHASAPTTKLSTPVSKVGCKTGANFGL